MTSGEAVREHLGQLTAVGPARASSPGNRLPLWRALGERTWMRGQQWRSGKARHPRRRRRRSWGGGWKSFRGGTHNSDWDAALAAAPIGQASPRSAASAELPAAAGEAAFTEIHWKGALARAERAGKAPARLGLVLRLCALAASRVPIRLLGPSLKKFPPPPPGGAPAWQRRPSFRRSSRRAPRAAAA